MSHGNGSAPKLARAGGERLYPFPDEDMWIAGADEPVVERHVRRYVEAVEAAVTHNGRAAHWLDIACGSGYGASVVAKTNPASYTGVDASDEAIEYARRHFATSDRTSFVVADIIKWQPPRTYDAVLSIETLEHLLRDEQRVFVDRLFGCLVPGGVLVLSCPVGNGSKPVNPWHLHEPTLNEIKSYMGDGLKRMYVERSEGTFGPFWQCYAVGVK